MNLTIYLVLAHFLADYPLQTNWVARYKQNHWLGLLVHTATHLVISAILLFPFLHDMRVWWAILTIFVTHTISDQIKINHNKKGPQSKLLFYYLLDQSVHMGVIVAIGFYLGLVIPQASPFWLSVYDQPSVVYFLLTLVLATYFYDITQWTYRCSGSKNIIYKRNYKLMARNAVIVIFGFAIYWMTK